MVVGTGSAGGGVEAHIHTWLCTVVGRWQVDVFGALHAALHSAIFVVAHAVGLARLTIGHIAPNDAVVVFVVALLVVYTADAFRGEVHHKIAVVGGEFASGVHAAGFLGRVVGEDAVLEGRLGIIIKV